MTKAPRLWHVSTFSPLPLQVPPAVRESEGSFFCEETLSSEIFFPPLMPLQAAQLRHVQRARSCFFFWLRRVFNTLPASPDCHSSRVRARVPKRGWWECLRQCVLETTRSRHMDEDSDGASDSHCESRSLKQTNKQKRINLVIQSVGFFCTILWTRLTRRFDSVYQEEVVHVTIFTFSLLMNNVSLGLCKDCTVWGGGGC